MKLDRNVEALDSGKYAVVKLRRLRQIRETEGQEQFLRVKRSLDCLERAGVLTYGKPGSADEFFVLMLKDEFAAPALRSYAAAANGYDNEYGGEVLELANRSGDRSPHCKRPD